jgi:hypothetical protein
LLRQAGFGAEVLATSFGAWRIDRVVQQQPWGTAEPRGSWVVLKMDETYAPALGGGAAALLGGLAVLWVLSWPLRVVIRPVLGGDIWRAADPLGPEPGPGVVLGWDVATGDFESRELPPEPPGADRRPDR